MKTKTKKKRKGLKIIIGLLFVLGVVSAMGDNPNANKTPEQIEQAKLNDEIEYYRKQLRKVLWKYLSKNTHNGKFEIVDEELRFDISTDEYYFYMDFRAKNAFGATIKDEIAVKTKKDSNKYEIIYHR